MSARRAVMDMGYLLRKEDHIEIEGRVLEWVFIRVLDPVMFDTLLSIHFTARYVCYC